MGVGLHVAQRRCSSHLASLQDYQPGFNTEHSCPPTSDLEFSFSWTEQHICWYCWHSLLLKRFLIWNDIRHMYILRVIVRGLGATSSCHSFRTVAYALTCAHWARARDRGQRAGGNSLKQYHWGSTGCAALSRTATTPSPACVIQPETSVSLTWVWVRMPVYGCVSILGFLHPRQASVYCCYSNFEKQQKELLSPLPPYTSQIKLVKQLDFSVLSVPLTVHVLTICNHILLYELMVRMNGTICCLRQSPKGCHKKL